MKRKFILHTLALILFTALFFSCATSKLSEEKNQEAEAPSPTPQITDEDKESFLSITFAGDIMAHTPNHKISSYDKIWKDVKQYIEDSDLALANIESPIDRTKEVASYPNFNLPESYVQAAIDAGFDAFSLANNHSNDQGASGIAQTIITSEDLVKKNEAKGKQVYFSGLRKSTEESYSYNLIEKKGWKILFLPVTEILNYPYKNQCINFVHHTEKERKEFIEFCKKLRKENPCDLFIISMHANEPEYTRNITRHQKEYYHALLEVCDVVWANHAHIIKDREIVRDEKTGRDKLIMYANGNTISAQRTRPELDSKNPIGERDNTGDGLLYQVTFSKSSKKCYNENGECEEAVKITSAKPIFITTYINTAWEFVIKPLNQEFVDYLQEAGRSDWKQYIERRIKINNEYTKDITTWQ
ncbi:MAG: CapA family protein [Treponema sp.]|nr:CapA family protein [Treponema sp.]